MNKYDAIIIGAGAAGLMCAGVANKLGRKILILEHTNKIGEKIRISGGGRCNFTNKHITIDNFISNDTNFAKYFLKNYNNKDFIDLVKRYKIDYHEKTLGQLFCNYSSKSIIEMLINETIPNTKIINNCNINDINKIDDFSIDTNYGIFISKKLVIATGGLSIPKIGASSFGYDIAKKFDINIIKTRPALVPLITESSDIAGISIDSIAKYCESSFRENILFTHKGLSGPAILQISSYIENTSNSYLEIDLLPDYDLKDILIENKNSKLFLYNILKKYLPNRFIEYHFPVNKKIAEYKNNDLSKIAENIHKFRVKLIGDEGYNKAEVTIGGIDTRELSNRTLESKKVPGLYFIGELVDVTGWLGGYNFQWAWSSGYCSGITL